MRFACQLPCFAERLRCRVIQLCGRDELVLVVLTTGDQHASVAQQGGVCPLRGTAIDPVGVNTPE